MILIIGAPCKLKKCPWCGKEPNLYEEKLWSDNHGHKGNYAYYIACDNTICAMKPSTRKYNDNYISAETAVNSVCKIWNDRK